MIGIFDSGVGGLSVFREIKKVLPEEDYIYYSDNANCPYGGKPQEFIIERAKAITEQLLSEGAEIIVVACNTATATAIAELRATYTDTIIVGIEPALKVAADHFPGSRVGVMATPVTLREEKFSAQLQRFPQVRVTPIPVTGLVELIETGASSQAIRSVLHTCLDPFVGKLDAVVLGCTHYPFAAKEIQEILGPDTVLLDGSIGTAAHTRHLLEKAGLLLAGEGSITIENSSPDAAIIARCRELIERK